MLHCLITFSLLDFIDYVHVRKYDSYFIKKRDEKLMQNASGFFIIKYDSFNSKMFMRCLPQRVAVITKCIGAVFYRNSYSKNLLKIHSKKSAMETFLYCFFVTLLNKNISWWSFPNELREIYIFLTGHFWENAFVFN